MVRDENDDTTIVDDPVEAAGASNWPDALGLCAGGVHHWIHRLEAIRQHGGLPPDIALGVNAILAGYLDPAADALMQMSETKTWTPDA